MLKVHDVRASAHPSRNHGFTLLEVLVAVAVAGVAVSIFVSMFTASVALARTTRNETVAVSLAEEQLELLRRDPKQVVWQMSGAPGELVELTPTMQNVGQTFSAPALLPANPASQRREKNLYTQFEWKAFAKVPGSTDSFIEVVMEVYWTDAGKVKSLALTSAIPRRLVTASAGAGERI